MSNIDLYSNAIDFNGAMYKIQSVSLFTNFAVYRTSDVGKCRVQSDITCSLRVLFSSVLFNAIMLM